MTTSEFFNPLVGANKEQEPATGVQDFLRPVTQAVLTTQAYSPQSEVVDLQALVAELTLLTKNDLSHAEAMLMAQALTLDAMFNNLAQRVALRLDNESPYTLQRTEAYLRLALKAQGQGRATLEALAKIKNPPVVIAQTNIANGPQQINFGAKPTFEGDAQ